MFCYLKLTVNSNLILYSWFLINQKFCIVISPLTQRKYWGLDKTSNYFGIYWYGLPFYIILILPNIFF